MNDNTDHTNTDDSTNALICDECHGARLSETGRNSDETGETIEYECDACGSSGNVEHTASGAIRYWGSVTTPRRVDLERVAAYAGGRK